MSFIRGRNYINGSWIDAPAGGTSINPSNLHEVVAEYTASNTQDANEALAAARGAARAWARYNPQARSDLLRRIGDAFFARAEEIGTLLAREEGKLLREGIGEVQRAAQHFHFYASEALRNAGQFLPSIRDGHSIVVSHEPVGVVTAITPWNFPIAIPAWKTAAALAYGNTVILKPSEFTPGCAVLFAEVLAQAGVPAGVFNLLLGDGREIGSTLIAGSDAVTFTGSTATGYRIVQMAAPQLTKVQLELGGKNPFVVLDDADLDIAVEVAALGTWGQTGQRCTASERIIVTKGIHDAFVERFVQRARSIRPGSALDPSSDIGPVATQAQQDRNCDFVQKALGEGAELAAGGAPVEGDGKGLYFAPTLFVGTRNDMAMNRHESFGPIAAIIPVDDLEEAISVANDSNFALSSGIATTDLRNAEKFRRDARAGIVMVNAPTAGLDYHVPFGGRSPSGYGGREQGTACADFFTEIKTTYINHGVI